METGCIDIYANLCAALLQLEEANRIILDFSKNKYAPKHTIKEYCRKYGIKMGDERNEQ